MTDKPLTLKTPDPVDVQVGGRVRMRRKFLGLSQTDLAEKLELTFQQVQKYESGANRVSASKLYQTSLALRVPISYFFEDLDAEADAPGGSPGFTHRTFLGLDEGIALAAAFPRLKNPKHRRTVIDLIRSLADD